VVFQNPFKKTTICTILHLFSIIYKDIFQVQKSTFADLLECGGKEIGRKEKKTVIPRIRKFPLKSRLLSPANFGGFSRKFRWFFYIVCIKATEKNISRPFPVDKVKYVQQLKGNEYETRNNEHSVLHSEDETSEKR
jgi:hypothetical protein